MGQFWAYTNPNPATRDSYPFLLEIQSNLLRDLGTTQWQHLVHLSCYGGAHLMSALFSGCYIVMHLAKHKISPFHDNLLIIYLTTPHVDSQRSL